MIYGERIRFRHAEKTDLPAFVTWLNDPEVRAGMAMHLPWSLIEEEAWFETMIKHPPDERILCIEARLGDGWLLIGSCAFVNIDWRSRASEFGIMIGEKAYWNQGYGTEAVSLLLRHGFDTLNLNRIFLRVFSNNPRAIHCYEKAGFVHEGRQRQGEFQGGQYVDVLLMSVLREEYARASGS